MIKFNKKDTRAMSITAGKLSTSILDMYITRIKNSWLTNRYQRVKCN